MVDDPVDLLLISGSSRPASLNGRLLASVAQLVSREAATTPLRDINAIPHFDPEVERAGPPGEVLRLRQQIAAADGLVISTPEYNGGIPGALKDAIDWASRPRGSAALDGKPVLIMSCSPAAHGGLRALSVLRETLRAARALVVPTIGPNCAIAANDRFVEHGPDEATMNAITIALDELMATAQLSRRHDGAVEA